MNQTAKPTAGETVAIMKTNMGEIRIKFFPQYAPKSVENFVGLAEKGYYNGITFHRIIPDFMIQGGDPTGTGCGGESLWGHNFEDEFSDELYNLRGSLSMANAGPGTNGSQFFIVQKGPCAKAEMDYYERMGVEMNDEAKKLYTEIGGTPWLDGHHTVFGYVYEGMDTVDYISRVRTTRDGKPVDGDVVIENIEITTF